jgi:hypothetical protein
LIRSEIGIVENIVRSVGVGIFASIVFAGASSAITEEETLLAAVPSGYKVDFRRDSNNGRITEMVPSAESVKNWTEMVTVQVFYRLQDVTPEQFKSKMEQLWSGACPGSKSKAITQGVVGGYRTSMWVMYCPTNRQTGKPENTWFRAIQGADNFYVVQKAYKFTPNKQQEAQWVGYLQSVSVCDPRVPERACPENNSR